MLKRTRTVPRVPFARAAAVAFLTLGLAAGGASAAAAQQADEEALLVCGEAFDACQARCGAAYPEDRAAEAGCQAACAADRAVCEAKAGYEQAKPWVADQFRKMQRFFEGFSEQGQAPDRLPPPEPPAPSVPVPDAGPDGGNGGPVDL